MPVQPAALSQLARTRAACSTHAIGHACRLRVVANLHVRRDLPFVARKLTRNRRDFDYIEVFYNRTRRHSHLGGISPEAFEQGAA